MCLDSAPMWGTFLHGPRALVSDINDIYLSLMSTSGIHDFGTRGRTVGGNQVQCLGIDLLSVPVTVNPPLFLSDPDNHKGYLA